MSLKRLIFPLILSLAVTGIFIFSGKDQAKGANFIYSVQKPLLLIGSFTDQSGNMAATGIAALSDMDFDPVDEVPSFGFSSAKHWIKLRVFNFDNSPVEKILEVNNPILNQCNLYELSGASAKKLYSGGDEQDFATRHIAHLNYQFPVQLAPNSSREFLLEVSTKGEQLQIPLGLRSATEISVRDEKDRLLRGVYFGIILFVLLFNLFIYLIIKERSSLFYVLYVAALFMLQLSLGGFAFRYLWPESSYLANVANPFFASISIFALIRFTQLFLDLKTLYPKLNKVYEFLGYPVALNSLLALIYTPFFFKFSVLAINSLALFLNILIIPTVVFVMKKDFKPARYFLYAFLVLIASVFFFVLNNFGVFNSEFYAAYGLQIGSAIEVILLSFAIVDKFKRFREDAVSRLVIINKMKAKANEELEKKVDERTREIIAQKQVVEKQKEEIVDSIRYAERIQKSILPTESEISGLFSKNFVLFKPRDIVSGDFYWFGRTRKENPWKGAEELHLFAAVDCTGHGVPGALMSILGHNGLEQTLKEPNIQSPAEALNFINNEIIRALQHDSTGQLNVRDGMDIVYCAFNPQTRILEFAGAKNNLYIFREGEFIEIKGDRKSIGANYINGTGGFTNHCIELIPGDRIYTFTDGYPDQFGGLAGKKLKSKSLLTFISEAAHLEMGIQKKILLEQFESWRGQNEQIDDVCILGIHID